MKHTPCPYVLLLIACTGAKPDVPARTLVDPPGSSAFEEGMRAAASGDSLRAEQYYVAALDRGWPEVEVVPELVRACVRANRLTSAIQYAEPFLGRHPGHLSMRHLLAALFVAVGRQDRARAELEEIIRRDPSHATAQFLLGSLLLPDTRGRAHLLRYLTLEPGGRHAAEAASLLDRNPTQLVESGDRLGG
jgi:tetratricopeptide (TPR) repeat protein